MVKAHDATASQLHDITRLAIFRLTLSHRGMSGIAIKQRCVFF